MAKPRTVRPTGTALHAEHISRSVLFVHGQRVILDRALAAIYEASTQRKRHGIGCSIPNGAVK
jgi:hypothetical protein